MYLLLHDLISFRVRRAYPWRHLCLGASLCGGCRLLLFLSCWLHHLLSLIASRGLSAECRHPTPRGVLLLKLLIGDALQVLEDVDEERLLVFHICLVGVADEVDIHTLTRDTASQEFLILRICIWLFFKFIKVFSRYLR